MLGEEPLRDDAAACPSRLVDATLEDDLQPVGKSHSNDLGQMRDAEQNLVRRRSQELAAPSVSPERQHDTQCPGMARGTCV